MRASLDLSTVKQNQRPIIDRPEAIYMLIHNLRCPPTVITGSLKLIEESLPETAQGSELCQALDLANLGAQRLSDTVNSLLELGQFELRGKVIEHRPYSLAEIARDLSARGRSAGRDNLGREQRRQRRQI